MIRISQTGHATIVIHDGLDVSWNEGTITIKPIAFLPMIGSIGAGISGNVTGISQPNFTSQAACNDMRFQAYQKAQEGDYLK